MLLLISMSIVSVNAQCQRPPICTKVADEIIAPAPTTTPTATSKPTVAHESQPIIIYIICGALLLITAIFLLLKCRKRPNMV